ncbi:hypothetical protein NPIL_463021 [Nephila pilipes]|uniref:RNase H type-1 domain-containing protein n=1 Tax=Nephila pilipes TaxID=299642 RepID=A0A8X6N0M6_NEPPI|nr:hypothetical protein NPIL_463021 [Nephila pilipes]
MNKSHKVFHAASVVAQSKKDRVPSLGRVPYPKNKLQSPKTLKIPQLNINGISTNGARIKLDQGLPNELQELLTAGSICISDLNAKHPLWVSIGANLRDNELINMIDDQGFTILNDDTPSHYSYSYNSKEALDISFVSSELALSCADGMFWKILDSRSSNDKLWKLEKNIFKKQPQVQKCNTIQCNEGNIAEEDGQAANMLSKHYKNGTHFRCIRMEAKMVVNVPAVEYASYIEIRSVRDSVGVEILKNLKRLSTSHLIHLQWIPSHDGVEGNEIADTLAKAGDSESSVPTAPLTYLENFLRVKSQNKTT